MDNITYIILRVATTLIALTVAYYVVPLLRQSLEKLNDEKLIDFINMAVYAAQQTLHDEKGAVRKQYVLDRVSAWLEDKEINISADQIDLLIESAVLTMKNATK